ncbi:S1/P1 nuclease [Bradyrhizobium yuanmingense]|uniref:S1/P1 nuclease n=1 Tax=Bradyrhizobium yuanmingense TaxID=108015 RepID=UPI0021A27F9D|nr:S1/P1 nuclease [Bradyrhizobium sp. CB1024]UWU82997.1 S1/P1 nuclease [Bradyrhizobium sp. CB1024]
MRRLFIALLIVILSPTLAAAWGDTGHKVVCEIAFRIALPEVRAEIRRLMKGEEQFDFFREVCIFPDHPRTRDTEHYVNLARTAKGIDAAPCPLAPKCVLSAIESDMAVLSSSATDARKLTALKYLGHWVGDLHQPLHVSFGDDRGGNSVSTNGACSPNLHSAWDTCLVLKTVGEDPIAAASDIAKSITPALQELWTQASDPRDWANESFAISRAAATQYCVRHGDSCDQPTDDIVIDAAYIEANREVVRTQLAKAGVRLAHLLNKVLQP